MLRFLKRSSYWTAVHIFQTKCLLKKWLSKQTVPNNTLKDITKVCILIITI